jgi:transposase
MRKPGVQLPVQEKARVVIAVLAGEISAAEGARRHGVSTNAVLRWWARFLDAAPGRWRIRSPARIGAPARRRSGGCGWKPTS